MYCGEGNSLAKSASDINPLNIVDLPDLSFGKFSDDTATYDNMHSYVTYANLAYIRQFKSQ